MIKVKVFVAQLLTLCNPMNCGAHQAPLSTEFSGQEYWSGLPCPFPGDLPNPGMKPGSLELWAFSAIPYRLSHQGSPSHDGAWQIACCKG